MTKSVMKPRRKAKLPAGSARGAALQTHLIEKHKFAAALAAVLEESCTRREFDRLVMGAPSRSLGELPLPVAASAQGGQSRGRQGP